MAVFKELLTAFPRTGTLEWIGCRPARRAPVVTHRSMKVLERGLEEDRVLRAGKRSVTLIQAEHLPVMAALLQTDDVAPEILRRNLVVSGINLLAMKNAVFSIGGAVLQGTGSCAPCSRMEEALGPGAYNAMRGHGGITASVLEPGNIAIGDAVTFLRLPEEA
ncbi:MOSC domain-containing protein [Salaquimonas pukyongi]|uniref:MOSC domain-containing protein n=1 Tax=Salaquimonas pukyongi TaxID=2712698 RepID=UPI00096B7D7C|nr:MOSC domain-containing protein [Salaquimonas pukyongi]